ncbi:hypothetical protein BDV12DRAFT_198885 [Aspergillus spectabilis]
MNWTGGHLRRHSEINGKLRKQTFGKSSASAKGPHQITIFSSLTRHNNAGESERLSNTTDSKNRVSHPQPPPNAAGNASLNPPNRLERMKRQLLEQDDWGAVGAARPVQVDFTSRKDLERFGKRRRLTKNDHERLSTSTTARPGGHEEDYLGDDIPENLEIKINGRRIGQQDVNTHEEDKPVSTSSQSMLLDENSLGSYSKAETLESVQNSAARSASKLSILSDSSYLRESPKAPGGSDVFLATQRLPIPFHRDASDSMEWVSDEPAFEPMQSTESSSIIPQPEPPVRKRFTIDDQAIADSQGRFMVSPPVSMPTTSQLLYTDQRMPSLWGEAFPSSPRPASQTSSRLDNQGQHDDITGPSMTTWLPETHPGTQRSRSSQAATGTSIPRVRGHTDGWWMTNRGENQRLVNIYGQPVAFGDSQADTEGLRELDLDGMDVDLSGHILDGFASGEDVSAYPRLRDPFDRI